jgi:flavodoxin
MEAVIIYESLTGNTREAAGAMAEALFDHGVPWKIFPVGAIDAEAVAAADLVIVGSWTDGALIVGQRPGKAGKLKKLLPDLTGKKAVVFCTYAITPGKTLDKLQAIVEGHGAQVVGGLAIRRSELEAGARDLVERTLAIVPS